TTPLRRAPHSSPTRRSSDLGPAVAGAVVRADAREPGDARLQRAEADRAVAQARLEDDRRAALADAVDVEGTSADVHEAAGRWRQGRLGSGEGDRGQRDDGGGGAAERARVRAVLRGRRSRDGATVAEA